MDGVANLTVGAIEEDMYEAPGRKKNGGASRDACTHILSFVQCIQIANDPAKASFE